MKGFQLNQEIDPGLICEKWTDSWSQELNFSAIYSSSVIGPFIYQIMALNRS